MEKFVALCAHFIRNNCNDDVMDLICHAMKFQKETAQLRGEVLNQAVEISKLQAENEFLRRTLEESENTD